MFRAATLPPFPTILDDLLTRDRKTIARHLGISLRTLERYIADGDAPRAVTLALFWETRWGWEIADKAAADDARHYYRLYDGLRREADNMRVRIGRLEALGDFGTANEPAFAEVRSWAVGPTPPIGAESRP